jgi:hypothetical protein
MVWREEWPCSLTVEMTVSLNMGSSRKSSISRWLSENRSFAMPITCYINIVRFPLQLKLKSVLTSIISSDKKDRRTVSSTPSSSLASNWKARRTQFSAVTVHMEWLLPRYSHVRALYDRVWCPSASCSIMVGNGAPVARRSSIVNCMRLLKVANRKEGLIPCNTGSSCAEMWERAGRNY